MGWRSWFVSDAPDPAWRATGYTYSLREVNGERVNGPHVESKAQRAAQVADLVAAQRMVAEANRASALTRGPMRSATVVKMRKAGR